MNNELLLKHFDRISDAPDAIPRLRQFILDLAVRGKLVERNPTDEPVSELLKGIRVEKRRRIDDKPIKEYEPLPPVQPEEAWCDIPSHWHWVRLGTIAAIVMGQSPPGSTYNKTGDGLPLINGPVEFTEGPFGKTVTNQYTTAPKNLCEEGDLLLCVRGSTTGRTNIASFRACIGRGVAAIRPFFSDQYIRLFVWRQRESIIGMGRGIAFPSVSRHQIEGLTVPLPPLNEQLRVVAKVDELMSLCDRLEVAQREREATRDRLTAATLNHLNNGADAGELRQHSQFFINHLPRLTVRTEQIKQIRRTIFSLAVRGRLVPQDPRDEPASNLLQRIQGERTSLVKDGRIRQERPLSLIDLREVPFAVPDSWLWARIGQAALFTEYGTSHQSAHTEKGVPTLKMGDIQDGRVVLGGQKKVPSSIDDLPALYLRKYDLLYNRTNSAELVGKTGIYLGEDNEYTFASYLIRIRCSKTASEPRFVNLAMNAPYFRVTQIVPHLKQQCGQANVNGTTLKSMVLPFPPLVEQRRIVVRVDELMAICDQLETQLTVRQSDTRRLLDAVLHAALTPVAREPV